jgi:hypothetical protein
VADIATPNRRWNSFVCPSCRFIFRVSRDHDGKGVVCPACRIMLRLPGDGILPGPLMLEREGAMEEAADFEAHPDHAGGNFPLAAGTGLAAVVVLGLFTWWLMPGPNPAQTSAPTVETAVPAEESAEAPAERPKTDIAEIDSVTKHFLEAKSIAELKPWIRLPEATLPRIVAAQGDEPYSPPGFKGMAGDYNFTTRDGLETVIVPVRTGDFGKGDLVLVKEPAGWRADWESWVGWSEMSWQDFRKSKPAEAKLFRVRVSDVDYYNFGFKDEIEWRSYRLDSPDGAESLFGYAERGSDTDVRIDPRDAQDGKRMLVMLKFPPDAPGDNQVLIDRVVAEGWLDPGKASPP